MPRKTSVPNAAASALSRASMRPRPDAAENADRFGYFPHFAPPLQ